MSVSLANGTRRTSPSTTCGRCKKASTLIEARTRMTPLGPELRIYMGSGESGGLELLWSEVPRDGRAVGELAEQERADYEALGYTEP